MMWHAKPFPRAVFLTPMERIDPSGRRLAEAMMPFSRCMSATQDAYNRSLIGRLFGPILPRRLFTDAELMRRMTFHELAEDALAVELA